LPRGHARRRRGRLLRDVPPLARARGGAGGPPDAAARLPLAARDGPRGRAHCGDRRGGADARRRGPDTRGGGRRAAPARGGRGAAGMWTRPPASLRALHGLARRHGALFIADEVATGFGRTGRLFACEHAGITPDLLCVAKGISGGYLPLAATLTTEEVFAAF